MRSRAGGARASRPAISPATFAQSLVRANLVDEYHLVEHPVALGRGKPLFATLEAQSMFALVECARFDGGAVALVYRRR
jgi:riboflavin biosynthesis pyrimidine reductase